MYCEVFFLLALEPAVGTRTSDVGEASSKFWVDQPGSLAALIFFAECEQSSGHVSNLVRELCFYILFWCHSGHSRRLLGRVCFCSVERMRDWREAFLGRRSPIFSRVFYFSVSNCASRDIRFGYALVL